MRESRAERVERIESKALSRAERASEEAAAADRAFHSIADHIPFGQPILVGHHSEKRHRRDIERMQSSLHKAANASRKAAHYRGVARGAEHTGISIQDTDARELLAEKVAKLERKQEAMKAANRIIRSKPRNLPADAKVAKLCEALPITEETARRMFEPDFCGRVGFPSYMLSNNNANIRRCRERLAELDRVEAIREENLFLSGSVDGLEYEISIDRPDGRVYAEFSGKPSKDVCKLCRRSGFKWSPKRGRWVRMLNEAGLHAGRYLDGDLRRVTS